MDSKLMDRRDHSSAIAKVALFLVFAIGIGIIFAGASGLRTYEGSGFSSESAFQAIYALSAAVESDWNQEISPHLESFTAEQRATLEEQVYNLLRDAWEGQKKNSGEELDAILEQQEENRREELIYKLLYITYQTGGPKVSSATKKALAAVPVGEKKDVQKSLLGALLDGTASIPAVAESAVEKLEGAERYATLMQLFFTGIGENGRLKTEDINTLKKGVRDKGMQLSAFRMIALEEVSGVRQFVISHSRTVILAGILIALDALLLAFLMAAGRSWHFDMKWIIILVIVDLFPESGCAAEHLNSGTFNDGCRHTTGLSACMAYRQDKSLRKEILSISLCADLYGAALCGSHGMAPPAQSECRHYQPVDTGSAAPERCTRAYECLFPAGADLGFEYLLLSLCVYHDQPGYGKNGSVSGGGEPNFRCLPVEDCVYRHPSADDAIPDLRCTPRFCQCSKLLRDSVYYRKSRPCSYSDDKNRRVCFPGPAGAE